MTAIDERIRDVLDADDKAFLAQLETDRGFWRQVGDSLTGPMGRWARLVAFMSFVLGAAMIAAIWQLLTATGTRELILWAVATLALLLAQGFTKDWFFSRMNMLTILREVKRLQVQVAMLEGSEPRA
jgi:predicted Kef-type K+ transport protein